MIGLIRFRITALWTLIGDGHCRPCRVASTYVDRGVMPVIRRTDTLPQRRGRFVLDRSWYVRGRGKRKTSSGGVCLAESAMLKKWDFEKAVTPSFRALHA